MKKEITYSGSVINEGKLYILFSGDVSDINSQYASGDVEQLDDAVNTLRACAASIEEYADAGRAAVLRAKCNNVAEGQECYITTSMWGEKKAVLLTYNGKTDSVTFSLFRGDGSLGNGITRNVDLISVALEPTVVEDAHEEQ